MSTSFLQKNVSFNSALNATGLRSNGWKCRHFQKSPLPSLISNIIFTITITLMFIVMHSCFPGIDISPSSCAYSKTVLLKFQQIIQVAKQHAQKFIERKKKLKTHNHFMHFILACIHVLNIYSWSQIPHDCSIYHRFHFTSRILFSMLLKCFIILLY